MSLRPTDAQGTTGASLLKAVHDDLRYLRAEGGDVLLLVDDVDCRFGAPRCDDSACAERFADWWAQLSLDLQSRTSADTLVIPLLAGPEIEGWFIDGWRSGLGGWLVGSGVNPHDVSALRQRLGHLAPEGSCERWGSRSVGGACAAKFSVNLQDAIEVAVAAGLISAAARYHKVRVGPAVLAGLSADELAGTATRYFAPAWRKLMTAVRAD